MGQEEENEEEEEQQQQLSWLIGYEEMEGAEDYYSEIIWVHLDANEIQLVKCLLYIIYKHISI